MRSAYDPSMSSRPSRLPRVLGIFGAVLGLVLYLALILMFPEVPDVLFEEGGKAPLLLGIVGVALMAGGYWSFEALTSQLVGRSR